MSYFERVFGGLSPIEVLNRRGLEYAGKEVQEDRVFVFFKLKKELVQAGGLFYHQSYMEATKAVNIQFGHDYGTFGVDSIYPFAVFLFSQIYSDSLNKTYDIREFRGGEILDWMFEKEGYEYYEEGHHLFFENEHQIRLEMLKKR